MANELAEPYLLYGRALLNMARKNINVSGTKISGPEEGKNEGGKGGQAEGEGGQAEGESGQAEGEGANGEEEIKKKKKQENGSDGEDTKAIKKAKTEQNLDKMIFEEVPATATPNSEALTASSSKPMENSEAATSRVKQNIDECKDSDHKAVQNEKDNDAKTSLQLAWESLEQAKVIFERRESEWVHLAEAY